MATMLKRKASDWYRDLEAHPFVKLIMKNLRPLIFVWGARLMQQAKEGKLLPDDDKLAKPLAIRKPRPNNAAYNEQQNYNLEVFTYLSNLLNAIERIGSIRVYLSRFPQPRKFEAQGITEDQWITYHYSNYMVTIVGIYDTSLLLTNAVFALGLDPKHCNNETVADNKRVSKTEAGTALVKLNQLTSKFRFPRNLLVHRNEPPKLEILDLLEMISSLHRSGQQMMDVKTLDKLYAMTRREIIDALDAEIEEMTGALMELFSKLQPIYERTLAHR